MSEFDEQYLRPRRRQNSPLVKMGVPFVIAGGTMAAYLNPSPDLTPISRTAPMPKLTTQEVQAELMRINTAIDDAVDYRISLENKSMPDRGDIQKKYDDALGAVMSGINKLTGQADGRVLKLLEHMERQVDTALNSPEQVAFNEVVAHVGHIVERSGIGGRRR